MKDIYSKFKNFEPLVQWYIEKYAEQLNATILSEDDFREFIFLYTAEAFKLYGSNQSDKAFNYVNGRIEKALERYKVGDWRWLD